MILSELIMKNFRSYKDEVRIPISSLTAIIGKNDIGKSTILEAMEIFFNNKQIKIDSGDACVHSEDKLVTIGCVFENIPDEIIIDATSTTSLESEYLLNSSKKLEIHKKFDCSFKNPKESVVVKAFHPTLNKYNDLINLKNGDLKARAKELNVDISKIDARSNVALRKCIWNNASDLNMDIVEINLNKEDGKSIWEYIQKYLPVFALFQSDRRSTDDDSEVQDPMKLAISEAIKSVEADLDRIRDVVKAKAIEVAQRTLAKVKEMDEELAQDLTPNFKSDPKWEGFQLSLTGDNEIPINKRGSGVRRLILLNFFRAEVERKQEISDSTGIIYAIEEPETSQHPNNQIMIIESLKKLSEIDNCQVVLTTHVPGLAGMLPIESIRYVKRSSLGGREVCYNDDFIFEEIANSLGIIPDERIKLLLCVEGPHDVSFLKIISKMLNSQDPTICSLEDKPEIIILPLGGSTLKEWVNKHYLKSLNKKEFHIYDRDTDNPPKYEASCNCVNNRGDGSKAYLTSKRELENYLHKDAIREVYGFEIEFEDMDDVPELVAKHVHGRSESDVSWDSLTPERKKKKISCVKRKLNNEVALKMTIEMLNETDANNEIVSWLKEISSMVK